MDTIDEQVLSLGAAAEALGVSKATVRSAIVQGKLKGTKHLEGHYSIEHAELIQYQQNRDADKAKVRTAGTAPVNTGEAAMNLLGVASRMLHSSFPRSYLTKLLLVLKSVLAN